jgi:hypothetical protein
LKRHPIATMIGGAILAAWIPFWTFASGLSTIDFMRTSGGHPSIGTFYLPAGISAGLSVLGIGVMVYAFILLSKRTSADQRNPADSSGGVPISVPSEPARTHDTVAPVPAANPKPTDVLRPTVLLPDGRAISSSSQQELTAIYRANTTDQASRLLVGKWIKFSGKVRDNHGKGSVFLASIDAEPCPVILLGFGEHWEEQLSALQRGCSVTVRGQIVRVGNSHIGLENCELL